MKKILTLILALCFILPLMPASIASADNKIEIPVLKHVYFSHNGEFRETDGDNLLISIANANDHPTWVGAKEFTDKDGSRIVQDSLAGTPFGSARHTILTFQVPEGVNPDEIAKATLYVTVKNVKQTTSNSRLSVYGNSIRQSWTMADGMGVFGATVTDSGLSRLPLLGLTEPIKTGNQTGESPSNETITMTSIIFTEYIQQCIKDGYTEISLRLANTLGGIRIYDKNTANPPKLVLEFGDVTSVKVIRVLKDDDSVVSSEVLSTVGNQIVGSTFEYKETPQNYITVGNDIYLFDSAESVLVTEVLTGGASEIKLVYKKLNDLNMYEGYMLADEGAWCWFADPRALHYENEDGSINNTYIGYIDVHGNIKAMQYNHNTGKLDEVLIRSNIQPDDHNNPTFLVLPDERIMMFYSRHTDEPCIWYRVSREKGDITTMGPEKKLVTKENTTYPSPFILSADPDHIYITWRGINWHPTIARIPIPDENGDTDFDWGPYQIVQSTGARPYAKYASNGVDKIYITYTTGHPDNENPNWVYFGQIDITDLTLRDIRGNILSTIANGPFNVNKNQSFYNVNYVVDNSAMRNWVWQITVDEYGNPVIAMVEINDSKNLHKYYAIKWNDYSWTKTFLDYAGGHFHQTSGLELCYSGGLAIDPANPRVFYTSIPIQGVFGNVYEIVRYTLNEDFTEVIAIEQITQNSRKNNVRPFVIPGTDEDDELRLAWMYGDYYDWIVSSARPNGFPTEIHTNIELSLGDVNLQDGCVLSEDFSDDVEGTAEVDEGVLVLDSPDKYAEFNVESSDEFTVALSPFVNHSLFGGDIIQLGNVTYGIDGETLYPYIKVGDEIYSSSNRFGTSDIWQTFDRGTNGQYGYSLYKFVNVSLTYDGQYLVSYVNGYLDQKIKVDNLRFDSIKIGGFDGWVEDLYVYDRVLNQAEIKQLNKIATNYVLDIKLSTFGDLRGINIPSVITSDILLPSKSPLGNTITWSSSNTDVLSNDGIVTPSQEDTIVILTATIGGYSREIEVLVPKRNIKNNLILNYKFEASDLYEKDGERYVIDRSGNGYDAKILGNAVIDGTLNLTQNTPAGWDTNGYALAPDVGLENMRSYTFVSKVKLTLNQGLPRIYDFGTGAYYSVFLRTNSFSAGIKCDSTLLLDSPTQLQVGKEHTVAVTYDAKTKLTTIYLDGVVVAQDTNITHEVNKIVGNERNYIGRTQWHDVYRDNNYDLTGYIDDFYMFNTALTPEEIASLANDEVIVSLEQGESGYKVKVTNGSLRDINNATIYVANYTQGGELISVQKVDVDSILAQSEYETGEIVLNSANSYVVKAFLWDENLMPYSSSAVLQVPKDLSGE